MGGSGAILGPFLDSYHSSFGVLEYDEPFSLELWGSVHHPALITTWWVPPLFGLAAFIIGWMYILLDSIFTSKKPSVAFILLGVSVFTFQYWVSGVLFASFVDRQLILLLMTLTAAMGFAFLDNSKSGFITSTATALGGPLIELALISTLNKGGYHYIDPGETGFFPLWILPVYFLGGPGEFCNLGI